jgi:hypothetical protein
MFYGVPSSWISRTLGSDEAASRFGKKIERFADDHVSSDVASAAQICLPLRARLARLFPELSFEPT